MLAAIGASIAATILAGGCRPALRARVESSPPGARIGIDGEDTGLLTPARIARTFPPPRTADGLDAYELSLALDGGTARGRALCWHGGFPYPVFVRRIESLDGSAWIEPFDDDVIRAVFPEPGSFHLALHWWEKDDRSYILDGRRVRWTDPREVHRLPPGRHRIEPSDWKMEIEADGGFCVQIFEWGSGPDALFACFERESFDRVILHHDDGRERTLDAPCALPGDPVTIRFERKGGGSCSLRFAVKRCRPTLHIRVSTERQEPGTAEVRDPAAPGGERGGR